MTEKNVGVKYNAIGLKIDSDDIKHDNLVPETITQWHAISTAILNTSRQIHHEASTILYEEDNFYLTFEKSSISTIDVSFGVGMNNFRLMQNLTIDFHVYTRCPSSGDACRLMETLNRLDCSFRTLILDYYFNCEKDSGLVQTYFDSHQLTTSISAVNVQQEVEFSFVEKLELTATLSACLREFVLRTAASKSWEHQKDRAASIST